MATKIHKMTTRQDTSIQQIQKLWDEYGGIILLDKKTPRHPEFVYRLDNTWRGWAHFLGFPNNEKHKNIDALEQKAFKTFEFGYDVLWLRLWLSLDCPSECLYPIPQKVPPMEKRKS